MNEKVIVGAGGACVCMYAEPLEKDTASFSPNNRFCLPKETKILIYFPTMSISKNLYFVEPSFFMQENYLHSRHRTALSHFGLCVNAA